MSSSHILIFLILVANILQPVAFAAKKKKKQAKKNDKKALVDYYHQKFSRSVLKFSDSIDGFFADSQHSELVNESKLILQFDTFVREARGPVVVPEINYRLILPRTQKRLRLFIENENQDERSETSKARDAQIQQNRPNENNSALGVRYLVEKSGIRFYQDTGIIASIPPDAFLRVGAKKTIEFTKWILKIHERLRWQNSRGFTNDIDVDFDRSLSRKHILRMVNNFFWNDQDYSIRFENGPSLFHQISQHKAISYHAHVISVNIPDFLVTNYILQATYRQRIYSNWLFVDLTPFINFPRERNFARTPGFILGFDAVFGHI